MYERIGGTIRTFMTSQMGLSEPSRAFRVDAALALLAGLATGGFALWLFFQIDFLLICGALDIWLDSDPVRVVRGLESRFDPAHERSRLHPLWSIGVTPPFIILNSLVGVKAMVATYVAFSAVAFGAAMFAALRLIGLQRADSFLLLALSLSTSCAWLWMGIPETYVLGAVSIVIPLIWLAAPRGLHDRWTGPLQALGSLGITITNWAAGLMAAWLALGLRRAITVGFIAFGIGGLLAVIQYRLYPESTAYFNLWSEQWNAYGQRGTLWQHVQTFFLSTIAAPVPDLAVVDDAFDFHRLRKLSRLQFVSPTGSPAGIAALCLWALIAGRGLWSAAKGAVPHKIAPFVLAMVAFNFILHALYGAETFLYAMHFLPFFTFIGAWSLLQPGRSRLVMRAAIAAAIVLGVVHNLALFQTVTEWNNALPVDMIADPFKIHTCR